MLQVSRSANVTSQKVARILSMENPVRHFSRNFALVVFAIILNFALAGRVHADSISDEFDRRSEQCDETRRQCLSDASDRQDACEDRCSGRPDEDSCKDRCIDSAESTTNLCMSSERTCHIKAEHDFDDNRALVPSTPPIRCFGCVD